MPFHSILHPTDFSQSADAAFAVAGALARLENARLTILHVAPPHTAQMDELVSGDEMDTYYRRRMHEMRRELPADAEVECLLETGEVAPTILRVARQRGCDAIALGAVGRTASASMTCGQVAESVFHGAGCAVIAVGVPASRPESKV